MPANALHILHIVSSMKVGGMEHFVLRLAAHQNANGMHATVIALQDGPLKAEAQRLGVPVHVLDESNKYLRVLKYIRILLGKSPDIIHAHNQTSLHYAALARRIHKSKIVVTNHGLGMPPTDGLHYSPWDTADIVASVSHASSQAVAVNCAAHKLRVIHNGVQPVVPGCSAAAVRKELGVSESAVVGIIPARLDGNKGHDTLLAAMQIVQQADVQITLLIAGDGAEAANLQQLSRQLQLLEDSVRFLGYRTDVPDLLSASDFFVLPSLTEGLPLSMLEAMSLALPVVATAVGGIPEVVASEKHGLLIEVNNPVALANALMRFAQNPEARKVMGDAARERVMAEFTFDAMAAKYRDMYLEMLSGKNQKEYLP